MEEITHRLHSSDPDKPSVPYWHVWTDENGMSHQDRCGLNDFKFKSISSGAASSWVNRLSSPGNRVIVMVLQWDGWANGTGTQSRSG